MNDSLQLSKILILLVASCLLWVGLLMLAFMVFSSTAVAAGWIIAGAILLAMAVWGGVMFREIRERVKWPVFFRRSRALH